LALIVLVLVPIVANALPLLGILNADPQLFFSGLQHNVVYGFLPGSPYIDPSGAFIYEPAAREALRQWLGGSIPWWNHFEGAGTPLAGGLVPGAFSPVLVFLLAPNGVLVQQIVTQVACGLLTFAVLRLLGCGLLPSLTGGALFELNGTFAWLGSLWCHPVIGLPLSVIGIELLRRTSRRDTIFGMICVALGIYVSIVSSFIETGYLDSLLVAGWFIVRVTQLPPASSLRYFGTAAASALVGLMLAAPQLAAFIDALKYGVSVHHSGQIGFGSLNGAAVPQIAFPYIWGPIFRFTPVDVGAVWGNVGGYIGLAPILVVTAVFALRSQRRLAVLLVGWSALTIGAQFGVPVMLRLINFIPGVPYTAQFRYSAPSWEFAIAILCGLILSEWTAERKPFLGALHRVILALAGVLLVASIVGREALLLALWQTAAYAPWLFASVGAAAAVIVVMLRLMSWSQATARALVGAVLVAEAFVFYAIPTFAYPRGGEIDRGAMMFLQAHAGNSRFYSMNGLAPNYGTWYGVSTINYNDPLLPKTWTDYVGTKLDPYLVTPLLFLQYRVQGTPDQPTTVDLFNWNRQNYEALSVKYISLPPLQVPAGSSAMLTPTLASRTGALALGNRRLKIDVPIAAASVIRSVGILQANSGRRADGELHVRVCSGNDCATGAAPISGMPQSDFIQVPLSRPLRTATAMLQLEVYQVRWRTPAAVWLFPVDVHFPQQLEYMGTPLSGQAVKLQFVTDEKPPLRVYRDDYTSIFEVPGAAPYVDAGKCDLKTVSRDAVDADCPAASHLVRRELYYPGWSVSVGDRPGQIEPAFGLFQQVTLPKGHSTVRFRYAPAHADLALALWGLAVILLLAGTVVVVREREGVSR